jgi:hypothetical protein
MSVNASPHFGLKGLPASGAQKRAGKDQGKPELAHPYRGHSSTIAGNCSICRPPRGEL